MDNEKRIADGKFIARFIWVKFATRIVEIAHKLYGWDKDAREEIDEKFLRPGDYDVEVE
jgi:hypothetical protein